MTEIIEIDVLEEKHCLLFGNHATQIIKTRTANAAMQGVEVEGNHAMAIIVFAGISNYLVKKDLPRKNWEYCFDLTETIIAKCDENVQSVIYEAWAQSEPGAELLKTLSELEGLKKKEEAKK